MKLIFYGSHEILVCSKYLLKVNNNSNIIKNGAVVLKNVDLFVNLKGVIVLMI